MRLTYELILTSRLRIDVRKCIPCNDVKIGCFVTIVSSDGSFRRTITSEESPFVIPDGTVKNSDSTFSEVVGLGGVLTLEDYDFEFQLENETVISNEIRPAMVDETFIITANTFGGTTVFNYNLFVNGKSYGVISIDVTEDITINT